MRSFELSCDGYTEYWRLWHFQVMWTAKPCKSYHIVMAVALLHEETETIIQNEFGFTEILKVPFYAIFGYNLLEFL